MLAFRSDEHAIPTAEDDGLHCTTYLPDETGALPELLREPVAHIRRSGRSIPIMITTTKSDGSKTITAVMGS